jgi:ATP-binding cassette subfamily G (WHITE) protein 2
METDEWAGYTKMDKFKHELKVLTRRSWTTFTRTKLLVPLKIMQIVIVAILMICLFSPLGNNQVSVLNRSGCMYLMIIVQIFASVLSVVMLFPEERGVYLNEQASRLYSVLPYFISKLIIDIPIITLTIFGFSLLVYVFEM